MTSPKEVTASALLLERLGHFLFQVSVMSLEPPSNGAAGAAYFLVPILGVVDYLPTVGHHAELLVSHSTQWPLPRMATQVSLMGPR